MRRRDPIAAALGALVTTVLAGGVAWAAIPSDGGVYTARMLKNIGTVRLIDKSRAQPDELLQARARNRDLLEPDGANRALLDSRGQRSHH